jgi:hypothetical protein
MFLITQLFTKYGDIFMLKVLNDDSALDSTVPDTF